ncbi:MAG TPA: hypothetical protein PLP58_21915 [Prosthecobacter sp.]|nr:hypothetical protein [Prosthecobacter sp.]
MTHPPPMTRSGTAILLAALLLAAHAPAQEKSAEPLGTDFLRFVEDENEASLQTVLATYERADGVRAALAGAVHIADKAYFDDLNERFKKYDAVLYEMVGGPYPKKKAARAQEAADGHHEEGDGGRLQWVGQMQEMMRKMLELEGQMACVNYGAPNFIHADMTTEGFFQSQEEKQETFLTLWLKSIQAQNSRVDARPRTGMAELLRILMSGDSATEMKRVIGREFDSVEEILAGVEAGGGTTLIGERNRHALEVLDREIAAGKKNLAVFYGAAHLPDMEKRLLERGFKLIRVEHLKAWLLKP